MTYTSSMHCKDKKNLKTEFNQQLFFREVSLRINGNLDINKAVKDTFKYIQNYIPADAIGLHYLETDTEIGQAFSVANYGESGITIPKNPLKPILSLPVKIFDNIEKDGRLLERDGAKRGNCKDFSKEIITHFPELENYSMLEIKLNTKSKLECRLILLKYGLNFFTHEHEKMMQIVKEPFAIAMNNAIAYIELLKLKNILADENSEMRTQLDNINSDTIIGNKSGLKKTMEMVQVAVQNTATVLLTGETGTGKGIIAKYIHKNSPRSTKPFVRVQCGSIQDSLLDSELFGHEKGSFTGAISTRRGRFERAEGGTIFLDEIGELSLSAQVKLLSVLQEKEFERVGGVKTFKSNVRVIAATNKNLKKMIEQGKFREDLWFRLNVFPIELPPLRKRKEDIPLLTNYFIRTKMKELNIHKKPVISHEQIQKLIEYNWPGNVRELENVIERSLIISQNREFALPRLNDKFVGSTISTSPNIHSFTPLELIIRQHIENALKLSNGQIEGDGGAAKLLKLNPSTLRNKLRKFKIPFGKHYIKNKSN